MACKHQFFRIKQMLKKAEPKDNSYAAQIAVRYQETYGAMVGCVSCAEIKVVWDDGTIETKDTHAK